MSSPTDIFKAMLEGFRQLRWPMLEASGYSLPHRSTLGPGHLGSCPVVCIYCTHSLVNSDLVIKLLLAHLQGGCSSQLHPNCCLLFFKHVHLPSQSVLNGAWHATKEQVRAQPALAPWMKRIFVDFRADSDEMRRLERRLSKSQVNEQHWCHLRNVCKSLRKIGCHRMPAM